MMNIFKKYPRTKWCVLFFISWFILECFVHILIIDTPHSSPPVISNKSVGVIKADYSLITKTADMLELTNLQTFLIRLFSPHEMFFWAEVNSASQTKTFSVSISPKRFTPIIKWLLLNNLKNQFPIYRFETFTDENQHWVIKTSLPVHISKSLKHEIIIPEQFQMGLNNNGNLFLDNHSENLYLIFLSTQNENEDSLVEKQQIFDASHLANLLYRITDLDLKLDIIDTKLHISLLVNCPSGIITKQTEFILMTVRDITNKVLMDLDQYLEGNLVRSGNILSGQFSIIPFSTILNATHE